MSSKTVMKLQSALLTTGLVQPVSEKTRGGYLEILCRQIPGQEKAWLKVVDSLLASAESMRLNEIHVCRRYIRKNGQMVFGWHISLDCKTAKILGQDVDALVDLVLSEARPSLEEPVPQQEPVVAPQTASRAPLSPGRHPEPRTAPPRAPGRHGTVVGTPPATIGLTVVSTSRDADGKVTIIEEMPLPHVYSEMNIVNSKGKGAKLTGGG